MERFFFPASQTTFDIWIRRTYVNGMILLLFRELFFLNSRYGYPKGGGILEKIETPDTLVVFLLILPATRTLFNSKLNAITAYPTLYLASIDRVNVTSGGNSDGITSSKYYHIVLSKYLYYYIIGILFISLRIWNENWIHNQYRLLLLSVLSTEVRQKVKRNGYWNFLSFQPRVTSTNFVQNRSCPKAPFSLNVNRLANA